MYKSDTQRIYRLCTTEMGPDPNLFAVSLTASCVLGTQLAGKSPVYYAPNCVFAVHSICNYIQYCFDSFHL